MKQLLILLTILVTVLLLPATYYNGCYSYLKADNTYEMNNRNTFCDFMNDLGYNNTLIENYYDASGFSDLCTTLRNHGLDAILRDKSWSTDPNEDSHYSVATLTTSTYIQFEAEYSNMHSVNPGDSIDSKYWYKSGDEHIVNNIVGMPRVGSPLYDEHAINTQRWFCDRNVDNPGYSYTDLRYRWQDSEVDNKYTRIGEEIRFHRDPNSGTWPDNFLYITFRVKLDNFQPGLTTTDNLLRFDTIGYRGNDSDSDSSTVCHNGDTNWHSFYTYGDYQAGGSQTGYFDITIQVSYQNLNNAGLLSVVEQGFQFVLVNLNPRLYWYGNCNLSLDYITFEDELHREWRTNMTLFHNRIHNRLQNMSGDGIVKFAYGFDEPLQGQFKPVWEMQESIALDNSDPQFLTNNFDFRFHHYHVADNTKYYDHLEAYRQLARPNYVMPDVYPITPWTIWDINQGINSVQEGLDRKLLNQYRESKTFSMAETGRKFIPVVQAFGSWTREDENNHWKSWALPPANMQKCLKLLPLCYGADGIMDFNLINYQVKNESESPEFFGQYGAIIARRLIGGDYNSPIINPITYSAIQQANVKINVYGELTQGMQWQDAECLMVGVSGNLISPYYLIDLSVESDQNPNTYDGYVQCGYYYQNNSPILMLVNRRTNYFNSTAYSYPKYVPPTLTDYNQSFPSAGSQTVLFRLKTEVLSDIGTYPVYYDPYDSTLYRAVNREGSVEIGPGDGKMLYLAASLPSVINSTSVIKRMGYVEGNIVISNNATVTFDTNSAVTLLPNTQITVYSGSTLNIYGNLTCLRNSKIIVHSGGTLNVDSAMCRLDGTFIDILGGNLYITDSQLEKTANAPYWTGIRAREGVYHGSHVEIKNSVISGPIIGLASYDSDVDVSNSVFNLPDLSNHGEIHGIAITNYHSGHYTKITADKDGAGFYGATNGNTTGLWIMGPRDSLPFADQSQSWS